jgi:hypothetical protein
MLLAAEAQVIAKGDVNIARAFLALNDDWIAKIDSGESE